MSPGALSQNLASANLILVGTVHGDPQGYARAWRLLREAKPDLVTVEISRFSLRYRQRHGPRWQRLLIRALRELPPEAERHPAIARLADQVALPFEVRVARDWRRAQGVPWRPLDLGALARRELPRYGTELLRTDNLRALSVTPAESLTKAVAAEFRRGRRAFQGFPWRLASAAAGEIWHRERLMAQRLARHAARHRRVLHLGGWEHLVAWQDGRSLWTALAPHQPLRLLLSEADCLKEY